ncbi:hypothetical protein BJ742DRAFT_739602 [Cladochytrium replicatum]|nr:hypothetical protein BJ742DRAFT_739602 [Cladochytrium replicatum]
MLSSAMILAALASAAVVVAAPIETSSVPANEVTWVKDENGTIIPTHLDQRVAKTKPGPAVGDQCTSYTTYEWAGYSEYDATWYGCVTCQASDEVSRTYGWSVSASGGYQGLSFGYSYSDQVTVTCNNKQNNFLCIRTTYPRKKRSGNANVKSCNSCKGCSYTGQQWVKVYGYPSGPYSCAKGFMYLPTGSPAVEEREWVRVKVEYNGHAASMSGNVTTDISMSEIGEIQCPPTRVTARPYVVLIVTPIGVFIGMENGFEFCVE